MKVGQVRGADLKEDVLILISFFRSRIPLLCICPTWRFWNTFSTSSQTRTSFNNG